MRGGYEERGQEGGVTFSRGVSFGFALEKAECKA